MRFLAMRFPRLSKQQSEAIGQLPSARMVSHDMHCHMAYCTLDACPYGMRG
jgi:hypothetical protein